MFIFYWSIIDLNITLFSGNNYSIVIQYFYGLYSIKSYYT